MKIGYILSPQIIISGKSNGIKSQATSWEKNLQKKGHSVYKLTSWGNYTWDSFDVIHIFGTGLWIYHLVKNLSKKNKNIILSPIIDSNQTYLFYKISAYIGIKRFRIFSPSYALKKSLPYVKGVIVRSKHEEGYITKSLNYDENKVHLVMLSHELNDIETNKKFDKENFCLHVSSIHQKRKNVIRLIQAAKKYKFELVLAGSTGSIEDLRKIKKEIGTSKNIKILGFIDQDSIINLYSKAKVFALPSLNEGVGLVALNASYLGCDIVITKYGGSKEYYNNMAMLVDPYDINSIGKSIKQLLTTDTFQPNLKHYIESNFNSNKVTNMLEKVYKKF